MILHQSKNSFWKNIDLNVNIVKTVITTTNSHKYLGIIINRNIKWSEHIETIKTLLYYKKHWVCYIKPDTS